jgi:hypothetical protein
MARPKKFNEPVKVSVVFERAELEIIIEEAHGIPLSEYLRQKVLGRSWGLFKGFGKRQ